MCEQWVKLVRHQTEPRVKAGTFGQVFDCYLRTTTSGLAEKRVRNFKETLIEKKGHCLQRQMIFEVTVLFWSDFSHKGDFGKQQVECFDALTAINSPLK